MPDHTDANWVLHAIEREAMARATQRVLELGPSTVMGLTMKQVAWLILDYEKRTGNRAAGILEET